LLCKTASKHIPGVDALRLNTNIYRGGLLYCSNIA